ncbi:DUF2092 domain-containing protein [Mesorhizobium sp.]|uniref:DUF2092 domain-containing protein n=1 Tax=Mesorhizobium sp. TaxID=1871066 RepID=UPI000FE648F0|nr:DUF2092 domain-containing protein [Mesorhizobium sp.]RWQ15766.1 MAG: DUF2092 domain-containing protein [Mesorhizobium sp.]
MSHRQYPKRLGGARAGLLAATFLFVPLGDAFADDARDLLKAMSDYMGAQQNFSFSYQSSIEAVSAGFEKLQFVSSGTVTVSRPDKIRATRTGGFADVEMVYDGRKLTVFGKNLNAYAQVEAKGTLEDLADRLADAGVEPPGADLLSSGIADALLDGVTDAKHISSANVDGVPCEYLAFRTPEVDWQIWIEEGPKPIPRRYVITSKNTSQAPQYTLEIRDFKSGSEAPAGSFDFNDAGSAKKVDLSQLEMIDELPAPKEEDVQ